MCKQSWKINRKVGVLLIQCTENKSNVSTKDLRLQVVGVIFAKKGGLFLDLYLVPWLIAMLFQSSSVNSIVYSVCNERLGNSMKSHLQSLLGKGKQHQVHNSETLDLYRQYNHIYISTCDRKHPELLTYYFSACKCNL